MKRFDKFEPRGRKMPPLRTVKELADEFGVSCGCLSGLLANDGAPKSTFSTRAGTTKATWFNPTEVRVWWKALGR